jgi:CRP-like cAMP-binding protein
MNTTSLPDQASNELYAMLSPELRAEFGKYALSVTVPEGTNLIKQGVLPDQLVIVNSGKVEIAVAGMQEAVSIDSATAGGVFGMRAIVSGELPEVDVTSQEICRLTLIPRDAFLTTVREHPQMYSAIAKVLSNELIMAHRFLKASLRRPLGRKIMANS